MAVIIFSHKDIPLQLPDPEVRSREALTCCGSFLCVVHSAFLKGARQGLNQVRSDSQKFSPPTSIHDQPRKFQTLHSFCFLIDQVHKDIQIFLSLGIVLPQDRVELASWFHFTFWVGHAPPISQPTKRALVLPASCRKEKPASVLCSLPLIDFFCGCSCNVNAPGCCVCRDISNA
jgi:hypothetical protein